MAEEKELQVWRQQGKIRSTWLGEQETEGTRRVPPPTSLTWAKWDPSGWLTFICSSNIQSESHGLSGAEVIAIMTVLGGQIFKMINIIIAKVGSKLWEWVCPLFDFPPCGKWNVMNECSPPLDASILVLESHLMSLCSLRQTYSYLKFNYYLHSGSPVFWFKFMGIFIHQL